MHSQVDMDMYIIKNQQGRRQTLHHNQLFLIEKVDPEEDLKVAMRLFNVASTQLNAEVQCCEMHEASSPLIEVQEQAASTLAIDAQDDQESKLQGFIRGAYGAL